jgi:glycosyltransferase involved in cell wall biosynthesis
MPTGQPFLQIVGPDDAWVLERLARTLAERLPYAEFVAWEPRVTEATRIVYYVNYALYQRPTGRIDVAFFTHLDESQGFLERARGVDCCICMCKTYADWLAGHGVRDVVHILMAFDSERYRPRLVLGVAGKLDHPRKGRVLVERVRELPFVEVRATEGRMAEEDLPAFYQGLDYVLIPATVEGGPMSLLEGLGMGKPVIAPAGVGIVPELEESPYVRLYPAGDAEALVRVVRACYEDKCGPQRLVEERTWERWAAEHDRVFRRLLRQGGAVRALR